MTAANPDSANTLGPVNEWEELGRRVFSRSVAKDAANGRVRPSVFCEKTGVKKMSVDRLTRAEPDGIAEVVADAEKAAANRPEPPNIFCGWAVVAAEKVVSAGCSVKDSPTCCNRYHADIILPDAAMENEDAQKGYATTLAGKATKWKPYAPD